MVSLTEVRMASHLRKNQQNHENLARLREVVLSSLPFGRSITIEEMVEMFPWVRWADIFIVIAQLGREGELVCHQHGCNFEIRSQPNRSMRGRLMV